MNSLGLKLCVGFIVKLVRGLVDVLIMVISILISKGVSGFLGILLLLFVNVMIMFIRIDVMIIFINVVCYIFSVVVG